MAAEGMVFSQFYSGSSVCTPSRYALLTGRDARRSGLNGSVLFPPDKLGIHPKEITIAEGLKSAGYRTGMFGKWHLGWAHKGNDFNPDRLPLAHGFDEYWGVPYSNDMRNIRDYGKLPIVWGPGEGSGIEGYGMERIGDDQGMLTMETSRKAADFIKRSKGEPFFAYVPYSMPHIPLYAGPGFKGKSRRGLYGDVIEEIDHGVGTIVKAIKSSGAGKNTLVFFTSDNGPWLVFREDGGSNGLLREGKQTTWEGGQHVPGLAWMPGTVPAGAVSMDYASVHDFLPTAFEMASVDLPTDRALDGQSIVPALNGGPIDPIPFVYLTPRKDDHAIRYGKWKLHTAYSFRYEENPFGKNKTLLFNVEEDPGEQYDRSKDHPEIIEMLMKMRDERRESIKREGTYWGDEVGP